MSVKGDEVGNRYEDLSPEELQSRFDKEVFFAGYRGSPRLNSKFLGRKVVFSKKAAQHVKDRLKKMTDKGEKKDSFGGLPVTGEQMEIEKVTDEGYRKRFEKLSKLARKAKDYRGIHEIELLVNLIGALELVSDDAAKLAKVKLLVDGQIKSLYVGLKFGWSALKDDSSDSLFGINKEDAEKFESLAAKGKEEYLARVAKYRRPVGTSTGVSVPQPTSNYGVGSGRKNRGNSPCFLCNQLGHWASECPTKKR